MSKDLQLGCMLSILTALPPSNQPTSLITLSMQVLANSVAVIQGTNATVWSMTTAAAAEAFLTKAEAAETDESYYLDPTRVAGTTAHLGRFFDNKVESCVKGPDFKVQPFAEEVHCSTCLHDCKSCLLLTCPDFQLWSCGSPIRATFSLWSAKNSALPSTVDCFSLNDVLLPHMPASLVLQDILIVPCRNAKTDLCLCVDVLQSAEVLHGEFMENVAENPALSIAGQLGPFTVTEAKAYAAVQGRPAGPKTFSFPQRHLCQHLPAGPVHGAAGRCEDPFYMQCSLPAQALFHCG
jgi:hypothetical protein